MQRQTVIDISKYTFQKTEKSYCPCGEGAFLLASKDMNPDAPLFFLCAGCGRIAQAGVGEISPPEER